MKKRIHLTSIILLALLLVGIALTAFSAYFFTRLDQVVHGDLYRYGLQFNYEWAGQYWAYSRQLTSCLTIAIAIIGIAALFVLIQMRIGKIESTKLVISMLLIIGIGTTSFSAFFFTRLDYVVHNDLYRYGLQFSYEWAPQYWTYARVILGLLGLVIVTNITSIALILAAERTREIRLFLSAHSPLRISSTKLIFFVLFFAGVIALSFSINFTSSILAFIGLGLIFWGALLLYIHPGKYIKQTLLDKTALPSLASLDQMITELGYTGKGVYLPPKYLKNFESNKIYISPQKGSKLPSPEQIQKEEDKTILTNLEGILITPPGAELTKLFEDTLGTNFTRVDLQFVEQNIPRLLIEDLEIAQNAHIETKNNIVHIKIENSIYKNICNEARKLKNIHASIGCPFCSAIACALAKATGKPVTIESDETSEDNQTIDIEYRLLEETEEKKEQ